MKILRKQKLQAYTSKTSGCILINKQSARYTNKQENLNKVANTIYKNLIIYYTYSPFCGPTTKAF